MNSDELHLRLARKNMNRALRLFGKREKQEKLLREDQRQIKKDLLECRERIDKSLLALNAG